LDKSNGIHDADMDHMLADACKTFSRFEDETWLVWGSVLLPALEECVKQQKEREELDKHLAELDECELMWHRHEETRQLSEGPLVDQLMLAIGEDAVKISSELEILEFECKADIAEAEQDAAICRALTATPAVDETNDLPVEGSSVLNSKRKEKLIEVDEPFVDDNDDEIEIDELLDEDIAPHSSQASIWVAQPQSSPLTHCSKTAIRVRTPNTWAALSSVDSELHIPEFPMCILCSYFSFIFSDLGLVQLLSKCGYTRRMPDLWRCS
jgi:hypothetical protein